MAKIPSMSSNELNGYPIFMCQAFSLQESNGKSSTSHPLPENQFP